MQVLLEVLHFVRFKAPSLFNFCLLTFSFKHKIRPCLVWEISGKLIEDGGPDVLEVECIRFYLPQLFGLSLLQLPIRMGQLTWSGRFFLLHVLSKFAVCLYLKLIRVNAPIGDLVLVSFKEMGSQFISIIKHSAAKVAEEFACRF